MSIHSLQDLTAKLRDFDPHQKKATANPENATDPSEAGFATSVPDDVLTAGGTSKSLATVPETLTNIDGSDTTPPSAPGADPFTVDGSGAKSAGQRFAGLRSKLASFGTPATPAAAPAAAGVAPEKEANAVLEDTIGLRPLQRRVYDNLCKTASGRELILNSLNEVVGLATARELLKSACAEQDQFEAAYVHDRLMQAAAAEHNYKLACEQEELRQQYIELTKNASVEEIQKIDDSILVLKQAEALYADHPTAHAAFLIGVDVANKVAAAAEAAPPEAAPAAEEAAMQGAAGPAEGPPSLEELQAALGELVQSGQITEEQAMQLLQQIAAEAGGAGGGAPPEAGGAPPEAGGEAPVDPEQAKAAHVFITKVANVVLPVV